MLTTCSTANRRQIEPMEFEYYKAFWRRCSQPAVDLLEFEYHITQSVVVLFSVDGVVVWTLPSAEFDAAGIRHHPYRSDADAAAAEPSVDRQPPTHRPFNGQSGHSAGQLRSVCIYHSYHHFASSDPVLKLTSFRPKWARCCWSQLRRTGSCDA